MAGAADLRPDVSVQLRRQDQDAAAHDPRRGRRHTGTYPIQSERFYAALKGQGATVRLVFLPLEPHHYGAHESLQHMLWEMNRWLDIYVKPEVSPVKTAE